MTDKSMTVSDIVERLLEAKDAYYNSGSPIMSDEEFDALEKKLEALDPDNNYFSQVGAQLIQGKKITHPVPMLSMGKAKEASDVEKWLKRLDLPNGERIIMEPKIDGLSATCRYKNGKLAYVASRGDGTAGQDITHIAKYIADIKEKITFTDEEIEIRGELYLPKDSEFRTSDRPLRNICVGLINRKEKRDDLTHVKYAAYQITGLGAVIYESEKIDILKKNGFNSVPYETASSLNEIEGFYARYLENFRELWEYETDGIILTVDNNSLHEEIDARWVVSHHHHYSIAYKAPAEARATVLKEVAWQISRQGNIIPVAVFEPVIIGGARLERATLNNYNNVKQLGLHTGDRLVVERANDVIPFIRENLSLAGRQDSSTEQGLIPEACPGCGSQLSVEGVHLKCRNPQCEEQKIEQIIYWVKQSDIENVAEATIRTLYARKKIRSIRDIYLLTEKDFEGIEGFADKKIKNFLAEVKSSRSMTAAELISKLGIPLVQNKALKKLNIFSIQDFYNFKDDSFVIGKNIIEWKKDSGNMELVNELAAVLDIRDSGVSGERKKVCMTGKGPKGRKELEADLEKLGYEFTDTVTADTHLLITDDMIGSSSKLVKARKYGIKILTYEEFFTKS